MAIILLIIGIVLLAQVVQNTTPPSQPYVPRERPQGVKGSYDAILLSIQSAQGSFGPILKFFFKVTSGDLAGKEISMIRPGKIVPGNKLAQTLSNLGMASPTDTLCAQELTINVEKVTSARGNVFNNVIEAYRKYPY